MHVLVTGGAGFIASHIVDRLVQSGCRVSVLDKLTYAGNPRNLMPGVKLITGDICNRDVVSCALEGVTHVIHAAAESHVDRSIEGPGAFIRTNIEGTFNLLEQCRRADFRGLFLHLSTDEVFGELGPSGLFEEASRYAPNSPYSASKAASDHLVRAYAHTYGLRAIVVNCSNNYGPRQYPEKLIPLTIARCRAEQPVLIHGNGQNVRDWVHVEDCARAIVHVLRRGRPGETYVIGGRNELTNLEVVHAVCRAMDETRPRSGGLPHSDLIAHVKDRPGNDRRYGVDTSWIEKRLGWRPVIEFDAGLQATVTWYLKNPKWWSDWDAGN